MNDNENPVPKTVTLEAQKELFTGEKSRADKYSDLVVGQGGMLHLMAYEVITSFASFPGALGLVLRARLYPRLLKSCGRNVVFGRNVVLRHPHKIAIGSNVVIDDNCLLDAKGSDNAGIRIGDGVFVGRNTILSCKNGDITLGERTNIGFNCEVFSASNVTLGDDTLIAAYTYLIGGGHNFIDVDKSVREQGRVSYGIRTGVGVWLGAGAKVLDGISIGDHAIVGAGAVVTHDIPEYAVAVGIPAKVTRDRREAN